MRPSISVIIPTLNEEKYIESTLKALKSQDYKGKVEIIVADSFSEDKTVKIAEKYADKIIQVEKKNPAKGRNSGAKVAKGEILFFVDADTIPLFNTLTEMSKAFDKGVVGATCPIIPLSPKARDFALYWLFCQFSKSTINSNKAKVAGIFCAYRKDAFEEVGGFDESLDTLEDLDLYERINKLGKIKFVEDTLVLTSPRRVEKWGRTKAARKYISMYIKYLLMGKSVSSEDYKPIR